MAKEEKSFLTPAQELDRDLSAAIVAKDSGKAMAVFDRAFWEHIEFTPLWRHLKVALLNEDKPMLRLLIQWGAMALEENLRELERDAPEKVAHYKGLLRRCGQKTFPAERPTPQQEPPGMTPLMRAAYTGNMEATKALLRKEYKTAKKESYKDHFNKIVETEKNAYIMYKKENAIYYIPTEKKRFRNKPSTFGKR